MPTYLISQSPRHVVLRNFEGVITTYTEPADYTDTCHCPDCADDSIGVSSLLSGKQTTLEPEGLLRSRRKKKG
jgi:lysine 2,3-aminomutase